MSLLSIAFLISHGVNVFFAAVLVLVTIRLYFYSKIKIVLLMTLIMATWAVINVLLILPLLLSSPTDETIELIASMNVMGSAIVPALFILFIDAFEGKIDPKKVAVSFTTIGAGVFIALSGLDGSIETSSTIVTVDDLTTMRWSPITSLAIFPTVILAGIWTYRELRTSKKFAIDQRQSEQIRFMQLGGILTFFVGPVFGILGVILVDGYDEKVLGTWASEIVGYLFVSAGVFLIAVTYTRSKEIAFLQPQRLETMLIIYGTGIPIMQHDFTRESQMKSELSLVSGAITAITALMGEAFNVSSNIRQISFLDKELVLKFKGIEGSGEEIAFIVIADRSSSFIENSLSLFVSNFMKIHAEELAKGLGLEIEKRDNVTSQIRIAFGLETNPIG